MENLTVCALIEHDLQLIRRLRDLVSDCGFDLQMTRSCNEAILYLRGVGIYANRERYPLPQMMVLDTKSDAGSDLELLAWLRSEGGFLKMPVILLISLPAPAATVACALDQFCFFVNRETLWELPSLAWRLFFGHRLSAQITEPGPPLSRDAQSEKRVEPVKRRPLGLGSLQVLGSVKKKLAPFAGLASAHMRPP